MYKGHIVIVEDDNVLRTAIVNCYKKSNYQTTGFSSASGVFDFINNTRNNPKYDGIPVDIIVSDIVLPAENGFTLVESLKCFTDLGKIFISAKSALEDRIKGLQLGVDDYIVKPLDSVELLLRTEALFTRLKNTQTPNLTKNDLNIEETPTNIAFLHLQLNPESRFLNFENQKVELGCAEHQLLLLLIGFQGCVVSKQQILDAVYQQPMLANSRTIDKLISRLRVKLVKIGGQAEYIIAQRGKGFMLVSQL
jgi:DNA-binding response OmpR family regulator